MDPRIANAMRYCRQGEPGCALDELVGLVPAGVLRRARARLDAAADDAPAMVRALIARAWEGT